MTTDHTFKNEKYEQALRNGHVCCEEKDKIVSIMRYFLSLFILFFTKMCLIFSNNLKLNYFFKILT